MAFTGVMVLLLLCYSSWTWQPVAALELRGSRLTSKQGGEEQLLNGRRNPQVQDLNQLIKGLQDQLDLSVLTCKTTSVFQKKRSDHAQKGLLTAEGAVGHLSSAISSAQNKQQQTSAHFEEVRSRRTKKLSDCETQRLYGNKMMASLHNDRALAKYMIELARCGGGAKGGAAAAAAASLQFASNIAVSTPPNATTADGPGALGLECNATGHKELVAREPRMQEQLNLLSPGSRLHLQNAMLQHDAQQLLRAVERGAARAMERGHVSSDHPRFLFLATAATTPAPPALATMATTTPAPPPVSGKAARKCTLAGDSTCGSNTDMVAGMLGFVRDQIEEVKHRNQKTRQTCKKVVENLDLEAKMAMATLKAVSEQLGMAMKDLNGADASQRLAVRQRDRMLQDGKAQATACKDTQRDLQFRLLELKKQRRDLNPKGPIIGDCVVTPWANKGPCSAECGGGTQELYRTIVTVPTGGAQCPMLSRQVKCNRQDCPTDCALSEWYGWSACSAQCDGGVSSRQREVTTKPRNGGVPCDSTLEQKICNNSPCSQDCELSKWGGWGSCTRACGVGKQSRRKTVVKEPLGEGSCPGPTNKRRLSWRKCNVGPCPVAMAGAPPLRCGAKLDLVLIADSSGSLAEREFQKELDFLEGLVDSFDLDAADGVQLGAVFYSDTAVEASPLTADAAALKKAIGKQARMRQGTALSEGLIAAKRVLRNGRPGAESAVLVVTDGPPNSQFLSSRASQDLQSLGVRVSILAVGALVDKAALKPLVSLPKAHNLLVGPESFSLLPGDQWPRQVMVGACPKLKLGLSSTKPGPAPPLKLGQLSDGDTTDVGEEEDDENEDE